MIARPVPAAQSVRTRSLRELRHTTLFLALIVGLMIPILTLTHAASQTLREWPTIVSFLAIGIYSLVCLYFETYRRAYSLNLAHWMFVFFFLFYAPLVWFLDNSPPPMTDIGAFQMYQLEANVLILAWCLVYSLAYRFTSKPRRAAPVEFTPTETPVTNYTLLLILSFAASAACAAALGVSGLLSRYEAGVASSDLGSHPLKLIVNIFVRGFPVVVFARMLLGSNKKVRDYVLTFFAFLLFAVTNFPLSVSRFWFAAVAIGMICIALRRTRWSGIWFPYSIWFGLFVIMPFLHMARYKSSENDSVKDYKPAHFAELLDTGELDAYSMLCNTLLYTSQQGPTNGSQAVGNVLFLVPRSLWPDKPGGSGQLVGEYYHLANTNLSEPLPAEGYINFGLIGLLVYAMAFGLILGRVDRVYWARNDGARGYPQISTLDLAYPIMIGMTIFGMRGDFLNSFSYSMGLIFAGYCTNKVASTAFFKRRMLETGAMREVPVIPEPQSYAR